jgi:hypothetical protein
MKSNLSNFYSDDDDVDVGDDTQARRAHTWFNTVNVFVCDDTSRVAILSIHDQRSRSS